MDTYTPWKPTLADRLICGWNAVRYAVTEPVKLWRARRQFERAYQKSSDLPLVSIMMPTFKRGQLLEERTIPSILAQTHQNFEVIIVGDRSLDDTEARVARIGDPRIRFFHLPEVTNLPTDPKRRWFIGGAVPRNKGLELARGEWIAEMDDDDVLVPTHIEALLRFARNGNYEFVSGMYEREKHGQREVVDVKDLVPRVGGIETWLYRSYLRLFRYNLDCWRKTYNCPQEIDRQIRMHRAGVRIGFLEEVVTLVLPLPGMETVGLEALEIRTGQKLRS